MRALDTVPKHVEQGLSQAITCGTCCRSGRSHKGTRAKLSGNDPHRQPENTAFAPALRETSCRRAYNQGVFRLSIAAGRWFGVHVRVHISLFLLLALAAGYSAVVTGSMVRGIGLWLALCAAILVREIARAITAASLGMPLRALFLLPVGAVMALAPREGGLPPAKTRLMTAAGSAANILVALLLLGSAYGIDAQVKLLQQPWVSMEHILRSAVWLQVLVGVVNLLPSAALPSRRVIKAQTRASEAPPTVSPRHRAAFGLSTAIALAFIVSGFLFGLLWPVLLGLTVLLTSSLHRAASAGSAEAIAVDVRDVMLTEYKALSASNTLHDALAQTTHTLQEIFPVLRGERLVGWISRAALATRLRLEGDGFLQGAMTRALYTAAPEEKISEALRRVTAMGAGEFIPVVQDGAMIGILTPASLERAVGQLQITRAVAAQRDAS